MSSETPHPKVAELAPDLSQTFPRSPRSKLGPYIIAARTLDKCRAKLADTLGEYHFDCPLDKLFFDFAGISAEAFASKVAEGANDEEMASWIIAEATPRPDEEIVQWNNDLRTKRISEMPANLQMFLETYIDENVPTGRVVYTWFDVYDLEEQRI